MRIKNLDKYQDKKLVSFFKLYINSNTSKDLDEEYYFLVDKLSSVLEDKSVKFLIRSANHFAQHQFTSFINDNRLITTSDFKNYIENDFKEDVEKFIAEDIGVNDDYSTYLRDKKWLSDLIFKLFLSVICGLIIDDELYRKRIKLFRFIPNKKITEKVLNFLCIPYLFSAWLPIYIIYFYGEKLNYKIIWYNSLFIYSSFIFFGIIAFCCFICVIAEKDEDFNHLFKKYLVFHQIICLFIPLIYFIHNYSCNLSIFQIIICLLIMVGLPFYLIKNLIFKIKTNNN